MPRPDIEFYECECCTLIIAVDGNHKATEYQCPACKRMECDHGGKFQKMTVEEFWIRAESVLVGYKIDSSLPIEKPKQILGLCPDCDCPVGELNHSCTCTCHLHDRKN